MKKEISVGDWISSESYGEAVCTGLDNDWVQLRYAATRLGDNKQIWVANAEHSEYVQYLRPTDEKAQYVLTLTGPYGEGDNTKVKRKP